MRLNFVLTLSAMICIGSLQAQGTPTLGDPIQELRGTNVAGQIMISNGSNRLAWGTAASLFSPGTGIAISAAGLITNMAPNVVQGLSVGTTGGEASVELSNGGGSAQFVGTGGISVSKNGSGQMEIDGSGVTSANNYITGLSFVGTAGTSSRTATITRLGLPNLTGITIDVTDADASVTNEKITGFTLSSGSLRIAEGGANYDLALSALVSGSGGNALSVVGGQLYVAAQASVSTQEEDFLLATAIAQGGTLTTTGVTLPASSRAFYVYLDGRKVSGREDAGDTVWDYERTGTSTLSWNRPVSAGTTVTIVY